MHHAREASCDCRGTPRSSFDQTVAAHEESVRLFSIFSSMGSVQEMRHARPIAASSAWTFIYTNTSGTILRSCPGISKMKEETKRDQRRRGDRVPIRADRPVINEVKVDVNNDGELVESSSC